MKASEWLQMAVPSYQAGINLLKKSGASISKIQFLEMGITHFSQKMMREMIIKLEEEERAKEEHPDESTYRLMVHTMKEDFKRANNIFLTQLGKDKTNAERYEAARKIYEAFQHRIIPLQKQIRYYEEHGKLPEKHFFSAPEVRNPLDIQRKILTLRTRVSQERHNKDKAVQVQQWKCQIEELQKQLDALQVK